MSAKGMIVLGAVGVAGFLVFQKMKAGTTTAARPGTTGSTLPAMNMNGDMWGRLMGGAWSQLLNASTGSGPAFVMKDQFGRVVTSDGRPVGSGDYLTDYITMQTGLPALIDEYGGSDLTRPALYDSVNDLTTGNWTTNGGVSPLDLLENGGGFDFRTNAAQPFGWARQ